MYKRQDQCCQRVMELFSSESETADFKKAVAKEKNLSLIYLAGAEPSNILLPTAFFLSFTRERRSAGYRPVPPAMEMPPITNADICALSPVSS